MLECQAMHIGVIAPPWTPVPPPLYGGIELVVDELARGFQAAGHRVTLFTTRDSTCPVPRRWVLREAEGMRIGMAVPELRHVIAAYEALGDCDIIHDHTVAGPLLAAARSRDTSHTPARRVGGSTSATATHRTATHPTATVEGSTPSTSDVSADLRPTGVLAAGQAAPVVTTVHGPFNTELVDIYRALGNKVSIVCISRAQHQAAPDVPVARTIHHGIDARLFPFGAGAGDEDGTYCVFLGRMAPDKGAHRAIEAARRAGLRILVAAKMREPWEVSYFTEMVEPLLGPDAVYLGEVPHLRKLELLSHARALLFPIRWNEPFGLVMLEAMACGTPVLAFSEGAAPEVVDHGTTGFLCADEIEMAAALADVGRIDRSSCRSSVEGYFSSERMVREHLELFGDLVGSSAG